MRHLTRNFLACLLLAAFGAHAHAAEYTGTPDEKLPKHRYFQALANEVMVPLTGEFAVAAGKLASTSKAFCAEPRAAGLDDVRKAWRQAQSTWQPLEMLQIGPIIERRTQRQINAWPTRPRLIEPLLNSDEALDAAALEMQGAAGKGFPAMEYLLFEPGKSASHTEQSFKDRRCKVLNAFAAHIKSEADALSGAWREPDGGFARQLAEAGKHPQAGQFASADQAMSDIANLLIAGLDAVKVRKLAKPLEKSVDDAALERIESWRSNASLDHIRDNLRGFELAFFGAGMDGIGLDDYLAGISRPVLPRLVREDLQTAQKALAAIKPPLQDAVTHQRDRVEALYKAVVQLQRRMEDNIADALKVDLGFNANDGD